MFTYSNSTLLFLFQCACVDIILDYYFSISIAQDYLKMWTLGEGLRFYVKDELPGVAGIAYPSRLEAR